MRPFGLNRKATESLILAGAFDGFGVPRSALIAVMESLLEEASLALRSTIPGQMSLFDDPALPLPRNEDEYPEVSEFPLNELLRGEKQSCGVYFSGHPMKDYTSLAARIGAEEIYAFRETPEQYRDGDTVAVLCLISAITLKKSRNGSKMAFIQGEDQTGLCEILVFPKVYEAYREKLGLDRVIAVVGQINSKDEEIKLLAQKIMTPEEAADTDFTTLLKKSAEKAQKSPENPINLQSVSKLFLRFKENGSKIEKQALALIRIFPGQIPVFFYYLSDGKLYRAEGASVALTPTVYEELKELLGEENVGIK